GGRMVEVGLGLTSDRITARRESDQGFRGYLVLQHEEAAAASFISRIGKKDTSRSCPPQRDRREARSAGAGQRPNAALMANTPLPQRFGSLALRANSAASSGGDQRWCRVAPSIPAGLAAFRRFLRAFGTPPGRSRSSHSSPHSAWLPGGITKTVPGV